jgi:hypothetical protein
LQGLNCYSPNHPIIIEILIQLSYLHKSGKSVVFCWVRGYTGLPGKEAADAAATVAALHGNLISEFLTELSAVMFTPSFIVLFYCHGKMNG